MKSRDIFCQRSSNGDAMVSVNMLARRFFVMSLVDAKPTYKSYGCYLDTCPLPKRQCVNCIYSTADVVF